MIVRIAALLWLILTIELMITFWMVGIYFVFRYIQKGEEVRQYTFIGEIPNQGFAGVLVGLKAHEGFVEGKEVEIVRSEPVSGSNFGAYVPFLSIMKGDTADEFINLRGIDSEETEFILSQSTAIGVVLRNLNTNDRTGLEEAEIKELDVSRSRNPEMALGIIAISTLSLTIPSGMLSIWELILYVIG